MYIHIIYVYVYVCIYVCVYLWVCKWMCMFMFSICVIYTVYILCIYVYL